MRAIRIELQCLGAVGNGFSEFALRNSGGGTVDPCVDVPWIYSNRLCETLYCFLVAALEVFCVSTVVEGFPVVG